MIDKAIRDWRARGDTVASRVGRILFGDRVGLVLFLGATVFFGLLWRIDFFITDSYAVANALVNVADGHLHYEELVYGRMYDVTPGMHVSDGQVYGRNYGHVFLSLPFLWLLLGVSAIADTNILLVGTWSLLVLALFDQSGAVVGRRQQFSLAGVLLASTTFAVNVALLRPVDQFWFPFMALQVTTIFAAAFIPVVLYRLLTAMHDRRTGVFAGMVAVLATPVAVWATIPKRHTVTALLALLTLYSLYRSRAAASDTRAFRFRGLSYVWVGLSAWIHAPEGFVLLVSLVIVDCSTARSNQWRELTALCGIICLSFLPVLVTNHLIAGDPLTVPRMLSSYQGQEVITAPESVPDPGPDESSMDSPGAGNAGDGETSDGGSSLPLASTVDNLAGIVVAFASQVSEGLSDLLQARDIRLVFFRRGNPETWLGRGRATDLSMLESMPIAALLALLPTALYARWKQNRFGGLLEGAYSPTPGRTIDLFAVVYGSLLFLMYAPRIPVHTSITVRYLHPLYPLLVYAIARQPSVRRILVSYWSLLLWSYASFVLVGGQFLIVALASFDLTPSEAIQAHGFLALSSAGLLAAWVTTVGLQEEYDWSGAVFIALASAVTTLYVLLSTYTYFPFMDQFAVPISRLLSDVLSFL